MVMSKRIHLNSRCQAPLAQQKLAQPGKVCIAVRNSLQVFLATHHESLATAFFPNRFIARPATSDKKDSAAAPQNIQTTASAYIASPAEPAGPQTFYAGMARATGPFPAGSQASPPPPRPPPKRPPIFPPAPSSAARNPPNRSSPPHPAKATHHPASKQSRPTAPPIPPPSPPSTPPPHPAAVPEVPARARNLPAAARKRPAFRSKYFRNSSREKGSTAARDDFTSGPVPAAASAASAAASKTASTQ